MGPDVEARLRLSLMGENAILLDPAGERFDETLQRRIWGLSRTLNGLDWVVEAAPGMNNLLVLLSPSVEPFAEAAALLSAMWAVQTPAEETGRVFEAPTVYGGEAAADLEALATLVGLPPREVVARHAAPLYSVAAIGAMPGFPYLSGLDPRLAQPRFASPRQAVAGGSVIVGGAQAAIMPYTAPSGWRSLGRTAFKPFDLDREPAVLLQPGDRVRFIVADILA